LLSYAHRYNGHILYSRLVTVTGRDGKPVQRPIMVVYGVRR
jgi:hypothetical protein